MKALLMSVATVALCSGAAAMNQELPQTNAMKMAGSVDAYVQRECKYLRNVRCQVFVQSDRGGSLIGYLTLMQYTNGTASFQTDTVDAKGKVCLVAGKLEHYFGSTYRSPFSVKHETLGSVQGMFYLELNENRLRLSDERWNYCYEDRHIDDVWVSIGQVTQ